MKYEFDINAYLQQIKDEAIISIIAKTMPDEKLRKQSVSFIRAFTRRGIPADTVLDVINELSEEGVL